MSYRRPLNLMLIYTLPFLILLIVLITGLSFWIVNKHKEEQIEELIYTSRLLTEGLISNNLNISKYTEVNKGVLIKIKRINEDSNLRSLGERFWVKRQKNNRTFHYERVISEPERANRLLLTIEIPMTLSDKIHSEKIKRDVISFMAIGLLSIGFILFTFWRLSKKVSSNIYREIEEDRLKALIELAGATAHEMRQPLSIIIGFTEIIKDKLKDNEDIESDFKVIKEQCLRMDEIIKKMLNITHYKTLRYTDGVRILDIHSQGQKCMN